jgi:hypothetical protein
MTTPTGSSCVRRITRVCTQPHGAGCDARKSLALLNATVGRHRIEHRPLLTTEDKCTSCSSNDVGIDFVQRHPQFRDEHLTLAWKAAEGR